MVNENFTAYIPQMFQDYRQFPQYPNQQFSPMENATLAANMNMGNWWSDLSPEGNPQLLNDLRPIIPGENTIRELNNAYNWLQQRLNPGMTPYPSQYENMQQQMFGPRQNMFNETPQQRMMRRGYYDNLLRQYGGLPADVEKL